MGGQITCCRTSSAADPVAFLLPPYPDERSAKPGEEEEEGPEREAAAGPCPDTAVSDMTWAVALSSSCIALAHRSR